MRGDIAFFTQPIITGHSGSRAFANRREKMFNQYEKGFNEYRKSGYFKDKAATARETADAGKFKNKAYLDRRIKECKKEIRNREKNIIGYEKTLTALENGEEKKKYNGEPYTVDEVIGWLEREMELIEKAIDKQAYLENALDELGGVQFNKENIKVGYIVRLNRGTEAEITSAGSVNITYKILTGGAAGMVLQAAYAEISEIIKTEEKKDKHPFQVGEQFKATRYIYESESSLKSTKQEVVYEIIKTSDTTIQLKANGTNEKPITRKPAKRWNDSWAFSIDDRHVNTFYKQPDNNSNEKTSQENAPKTVNNSMLETAETSTNTISATQDAPVSNTFPQLLENVQTEPAKNEIQQFTADYVQCSINTYNTHGRFQNQNDIDKAVSNILPAMEKAILSENNGWIKENLERMAHNSKTPEEPAMLLERLEGLITAHDKHMKPAPETVKTVIQDGKQRIPSETQTDNISASTEPLKTTKGGFSNEKSEQISLFDFINLEKENDKKPSLLGGLTAAKAVVAQNDKQALDTGKKREGESL